MSEYVTAQGDTFSSVARTVYGDDQQAFRLRAANPDFVEPFIAGISLTIPENQDAPNNRPQLLLAEEDEPLLNIDSKAFRFWTTISITRSIDAVSTLAFSAPFNSSDRDTKETFTPFSFKPVSLSVGTDQLFTGTLVGVQPTLRQKQKSITVSCYSKPGVLSDCTPLVDADLEFNEQSLNEIIVALCIPFGISSIMEVDSISPFERVACTPTKKIMAFLAELAKQRGLLISDTVDGRILVREAVEKGNSVGTLRQGESPLLQVTPQFNPQQYFSTVAVQIPITFGSEEAQGLIKNPFLKDSFRPVTVMANDVADGEIKTATDAAIGRMFANAILYSVTVATWRDPEGRLWEPNTTIRVIAPDAMIYQEYEFLIKKVTLSATKNSRTAMLELVLPEAYKQPKDPYEGFGATIPENLPWHES